MLHLGLDKLESIYHSDSQCNYASDKKITTNYEYDLDAHKKGPLKTSHIPKNKETPLECHLRQASRESVSNQTFVVATPYLSYRS